MTQNEIIVTLRLQMLRSTLDILKVRNLTVEVMIYAAGQVQKPDHSCTLGIFQIVFRMIFRLWRTALGMFLWEPIVCLLVRI